MGQLKENENKKSDENIGNESKTVKVPPNFIRNIIIEDRSQGKHDGRVHTRFPPEPNGYLHIGHAKSICLNFGLAEEFNGLCNLRFDDTNPLKEEEEYIRSIQEDIRWLGFDWEDRLYFASDYFGQLYEWAVHLIKKGKAYVDDLTADEIRDYRGTLTKPGKESPYRNRSIDESLDFFERMKAGEFKNGEKVLRAKIDMSSPNLNMRDPVLYRILHAEHPRTKHEWCIYPMYDWAHGQSDSIEGITHSICTLEFEDHRPLYDWFIEQLGIHAPQQIEFARLELTHTLLSKRKLLKLVKENYVEGWDDPRMPTLSGFRRLGYTPASIRDLCERVGVAKSNSTVEISLLEHCLREDLNKTAARVMAVLRPLKVVLINYPEDKTEELTAENNPEDPSMGTRKIPFSREIFIERNDFMEDPPKKFFRLAPGKEVRLKHAYIIKCEQIIKDPNSGELTEIHCTYDVDTKSGSAAGGRKVKGTLHWVSAIHAVPAEIRLYDHLFANPDPNDAPEGKDFISNLNPNSLDILNGYVEPSLKDADPGMRFQFLRLGYFFVDTRHSQPGKPVFNRTVSLRDSWARIQKSQNRGGA
jgi:glutaminyl-tRNA synthetase